MIDVYISRDEYEQLRSRGSLTIDFRNGPPRMVKLPFERTKQGIEFTKGACEFLLWATGQNQKGAASDAA